MDKRIIFDNGNGVSVVVPSGEVAIEELVNKVVPAGASYEIVDVSVIPTDRSFRNAWKKNAKKVEVDITKAQEITKDRLRAERKPLLEAQDVLFLKAQETGSSTSAIATEKQRLRDITDGVDQITDLEELKALSCEV